MSGVGNVRPKSDKLGVVRSVSPMQQWNYPHQYRLQTACEICGLNRGVQRKTPGSCNIPVPWKDANSVFRRRQQALPEEWVNPG